MSFEADGRLLGGQNRPNQPLGWHVIPFTVFHHMIDWAVLRSFWNELVARRQRTPMIEYLDIAGFEGNAEAIVDEVLAGRILQVRATDRMAYDSLAMALCWQCYNLFEGPDSRFRPGHSPPPEQMLQHFAHVGATTFDFPIVVPPHGQRANTLHRVFQSMTAFVGSGAAGPLAQALQLLAPLSHLGAIPAYDVNWFGATKAHFLALSPVQRQQFFQACFRHGWTTDGEQVYAQLFRP
jgi:hypothetical protein